MLQGDQNDWAFSVWLMDSMPSAGRRLAITVNRFPADDFNDNVIVCTNVTCVAIGSAKSLLLHYRSNHLSFSRLFLECEK